MRVGIVRSDIGSVYLSDVENRAQRCFSSEPAGQSRYFKKPSDESFLGLLNTYGFIGVKGNATAATRDTDPGNVLRIRDRNYGAYTVVTVTSSNTLAIGTLVSELNTAFVNASIRVTASLDGSNHIILQSNGSNVGPDAHIQLDTVGNGSTLNPAIHSGWTAGVNRSGVTVSTLKSTIYPTGTTVNVSSSQIDNITAFLELTSGTLSTLVSHIADLAAPRLVETGPVLLSFTYGILSKLASSSFQPGGSRIGLPAHNGAYLLEDDGSTPFTL